MTTLPRDLQSIRRVLWGLKLIYFAIAGSLILIFALPVLQYCISVIEFSPFSSLPVGPAIAVFLGLAWILLLIGQLLTGSVPRESGGQLCAQLSAAINGVSLFVFISLVVVHILSVNPSEGGVSMLIAAGGAANTAFQIIGLLLFLLFARRTSSFVGNHTVARKFGSTSVLLVLAIVLFAAFREANIAWFKNDQLYSLRGFKEDPLVNVEPLPFAYLEIGLLVTVFAFFRFICALRELLLELTDYFQERVKALKSDEIPQK